MHDATLRFKRGNTVDIDIQVYDPENLPTTLAGAIMTFRLMRTVDSTDPSEIYLTKTETSGISATGNVAKLRIEELESDAIPVGNGYYELYVRYPSGVTSRPVTGPYVCEQTGIRPRV